MDFTIKGELIDFKEVQQGTSKQGKQWAKQEFVVKTEDQYNNLYCFEVFGQDKVDNLSKYNKIGDQVTVKFNIRTSEYKGKMYTSLAAWRIEKGSAAVKETSNQDDDWLI